MIYVKINLQTGNVEKYPYSIENLRADNPQTSFPIQLSEFNLASWGVYPVAVSEMPSVDHTKNVKESLPRFNQGVWEQVWEIVDASAQEIETRTRREAVHVRMLRDQLLSSKIDVFNLLRWESLNEEQKSKLRDYRQQLLDIPQQPGFPWSINWPMQP